PSRATGPAMVWASASPMATATRSSREAWRERSRAPTIGRTRRFFEIDPVVDYREADRLDARIEPTHAPLDRGKRQPERGRLAGPLQARIVIPCRQVGRPGVRLRVRQISAVVPSKIGGV